MSILGGIAAVVALGFTYCIAAVPTGVAMDLPIVLVVICAWIGYSLGGVVVVLIGAPLREWLARKLKFNPNPEKPGIVHRAWKRFGLPALALLAPVTIGPQIGAMLGLAMGANQIRLVVSLSLGVLPWLALFTTLTLLGVRLVAE